MDNFFPDTIQATTTAISNHSESFHELCRLLENSQSTSDLDELLSIQSQIVPLLRRLITGQPGTIFYHPYKDIDPKVYGDIKTFKNQAASLLKDIKTYTQQAKHQGRLDYINSQTSNFNQEITNLQQKWNQGVKDIKYQLLNDLISPDDVEPMLSNLISQTSSLY